MEGIGITRWNQNPVPTVADDVAHTLARVLREYGEEKFAKRIADAVVRERGKEPFDSSARLVELIRDSIPAPARRTGGNPAKRTFQALRIEVNAELEVLERAIPSAIDALTVGGRIRVCGQTNQRQRDRRGQHGAEGAHVR